MKDILGVALASYAIFRLELSYLIEKTRIFLNYLKYKYLY